MFRSTPFAQSWAIAAALLAVLLTANHSLAQAPAGVNYNTIQTANGQPIFSFTPGAAAQTNNGSLLRFHNGRLAQRFTPQRGVMNGGRVIDAQLSVQRAESAHAVAQPASTQEAVIAPQQEAAPNNGAALQEEIRGVLEEAEPVQTQTTPVPPMPGEVQYESGLEGGCSGGSCSGGSCGAGGCSDGCCGPTYGGGCKNGKCGKGGCGYDAWCDFTGWSWVCLCVPLPPVENLSVNAGVHGFKNPLNAGLDSSFGFHEGFNLGAPVPVLHWWGIGWQIGLQGVHSNYEGAGGATTNPNVVISEDRDQTFFTWGFYRRVDCGLQAGFVFDHLSEDYYYDIDLSQVRAEVSWVFPYHHEVGVAFASSSETDTSALRSNPFANWGMAPANLSAKTTDTVAFFYRVRFGDCCNSHAKFYIGGTDDRDLIPSGSDSSLLLGAESHLALSSNWALASGFTWLPAPSDNSDSALHESWNVGINVVWYPFGSTCGSERSYYRPLFNVADNGSMLVDFNR